MTDISKTVKLLLSFANLGCKQGMPNPQRVLCVLPIVKCPPVEPPPKFDDFLPEKPVIYSIDAGNEKVDEFPIGKEDVEYFINSVKDRDGKYIDLKWQRDVKTGVPRYLGYGENAPTFQEFEDFIQKSKMLILKSKTTKCPVSVFLRSCELTLPVPPVLKLTCMLNVHDYFVRLWKAVRAVIHCTMQKDDNENIGSHVKEMLEILMPTTNCQTHPMPKTIYNAVFSLWTNRKGSRSRLKQCPCCGSFFIVKKERKRGRPQKYCPKKCEDRFNYPSRSVGRETKKKTREILKSKKQTKTRNEIVDFLVNKGLSKEGAKKEYNKLPEHSKSSLSNFKRTYVAKYDL